MRLTEDARTEDAKHLLDLFELLYHWHDGPAGQRVVKTDIEEYHTAGCSEVLAAYYRQLREQYQRGRHHTHQAGFLGDAAGLAQQCLNELDPANLDQRDVIGELLRPDIGNDAPVEGIGQRWLDDACATAWRIVVPTTADQLRGEITSRP